MFPDSASRFWEEEEGSSTEVVVEDLASAPNSGLVGRKQSCFFLLSFLNNCLQRQNALSLVSGACGCCEESLSPVERVAREPTCVSSCVYESIYSRLAL